MDMSYCIALLYEIVYAEYCVYMCVNCDVLVCSVAVDVTKREEVMKIVRSSISTKFIKKWCVRGLTDQAQGLGV